MFAKVVLESITSLSRDTYPIPVMFNLVPVGIYLLKVNNRNTRTKCEISPKLTIKTPERCQWRRFGVFIVNFIHISHLALVFLLLPLKRQLPTGVRMIPRTQRLIETIEILNYLRY